MKTGYVCPLLVSFALFIMSGAAWAEGPATSEIEVSGKTAQRIFDLLGAVEMDCGHGHCWASGALEVNCQVQNKDLSHATCRLTRAEPSQSDHPVVAPPPTPASTASSPTCAQSRIPGEASDPVALLEKRSQLAAYSQGMVRAPTVATSSLCKVIWAFSGEDRQPAIPEFVPSLVAGMSRAVIPETAASLSSEWRHVLERGQSKFVRQVEWQAPKLSFEMLWQQMSGGKILVQFCVPN